MIEELTAALTSGLAALSADLEFQARTLAGDARAHGLNRLVNAAHEVLLPAGWSKCKATTWKRTRDPNGTDAPLRQLTYSSNADRCVFLELDPVDTLTITLYDVPVPGEMLLLERRTLPVDQATWHALVVQ